MRKGLSVVDLFCGGGGFSRGFIEAGFRIKLAVDCSKPAARTYSANFSDSLVIVDDIRSLGCDDFKYLLGDEEVDVIIGSPPCEPFTGANPSRKVEPLDRLYNDPQGELVLEFIRVIECLNPKVFIMENVPAILDNGLRDALKREFRSAGFRSIKWRVLKAEDYGTPSHRIRVFISNIELNPAKVRYKITVWQAIGDLPPPSKDPSIPNHEPPPNLSRRKLKRASRLRWGASMIKYVGANHRLLPNMIRLHPNKLAPTVLGSSRFIHPFENRLLTVREQARLMGFPDNHVFLGGRDEQYNQVGEAVPPPLARALAEYLIKVLT